MIPTYSDEGMGMSKVIAKYQVKVPSILMKGNRVIELEPIRLKTSTGEAVIYPPGSKEQKPKSYVKLAQGVSDLEARIESKDSPFWDADTLWVDMEIEVTPTLSEKEIQAKLNREMHQLIFRFLRLLRQKLPETPMPLPTSLQHSVSFDWGSIPSGQTLAATIMLGIIRVVSEEAELTEKKWDKLSQEMVSGVDSELWEDFIEDSKVALEEDDLNRATLYSAIGCEIFIKEYTEKVSKERGISPVFWKYLKDPKTETRVLTYYNEILHLVTGHSLKNENTEMYKKLKLIFSARNKIVHEGRLPSNWNPTQINQLTESIKASESIISWVIGLDVKNHLKS
ncbi:hypothetical protein ES703_06452 [subsurface metagenome]